MPGIPLFLFCQRGNFATWSGNFEGTCSIVSELFLNEATFPHLVKPLGVPTTKQSCIAEVVMAASQVNFVLVSTCSYFTLGLRWLRLSQMRYFRSLTVIPRTEPSRWLAPSQESCRPLPHNRSRDEHTTDDARHQVEKPTVRACLRLQTERSPAYRLAAALLSHCSQGLTVNNTNYPHYEAICNLT